MTVRRTTWNMSAFLVISTTVMIFGIISLLFYKDVPTAIRDVLFTLIGGILAKWQTIVDYHFGSSHGSARKTDMLNDLVPADATVDTTATIRSEKVTTVSSNPQQQQSAGQDDVQRSE